MTDLPPPPLPARSWRAAVLLGAAAGAWVGLVEADWVIDGLPGATRFGWPDASRLTLGWPGRAALWLGGSVHGAVWGAVGAGLVALPREWRERSPATPAVAGAALAAFVAFGAWLADPRVSGNPWFGLVIAAALTAAVAVPVERAASRSPRGLTSLAVIAALVLGWRAVPRPPPAATGARSAPDIVLITVASARADRFGVPEPRTPGFERLAALGVSFRSALTPSLSDAEALAEVVGPVVEAAKAQGYRTGAVLGGATLASASFDAFEDDHDFVLGLDTLSLGRGLSVLLPGFFRPADERPARPTLDRAVRWLNAGEGPSLLWVHLQDPAAPYRPPPPFDERFTRGGDPRDPANASLRGVALPAWLTGVTDRAWVAARYDGEIAYVDAELGRFLGLIAVRPRAANTAVAFVGVTGESLGEDGEYFAHGHTASLAASHVPLTLSWPDGARGTAEDAPVTSVDLARTLVELTGAAWSGPEAYDLRGVVARTGPSRQSACLRDPAASGVSAGGGCIVPGWFYRVEGAQERVEPVPRVPPGPWTRARLADLRARLGGVAPDPKAEAELLQRLGYVPAALDR